MAESSTETFTLFTDYDIYLFKQGKHFNLWEKMGAHLAEINKKQGVYFAVWAPEAQDVSIVTEKNNWNREIHKIFVRWDQSGIWEGFIEGLEIGEPYKYSIKTKDGSILEKTDPYAFQAQTAPETSSIIFQSNYSWKDKLWITKRKKYNYAEPMSIYEVHLGSWGRNTDESFFSYRELAEHLIQYAKEMGFTHLEIMPVMEHPFYGSWGYQITNYFAPTSRYGSPDDFKFLIDTAHKNNIGIILDWVPSHFPGDEHGLRKFDGSSLYEHEDMRKGFQPDWNSYIFNYGRNEVKSFLISNALFWIQEFHIDALRVDAVASMLYLDYSRKQGEWLANEYGGNENLEAIQFLKDFNDAIKEKHPGVVTIAEESSTWPKVSQPTSDGGLGFHYKWMMGWMHDTINYFKREPIYRKYHQDDLTFSIWYFWSEHFVLSFSHDEVVYGKESMIQKMPGDDWHKFANLRLLYGYMFSHPGAKLLFMGSEFAQKNEWNHDYSLDWHLLEEPAHISIKQLVKDLNHLYVQEQALHACDYGLDSLIWTDISKKDDCILCYKRISENENNFLLVVANFDQQTHYDYEIEVPEKNAEIIEYKEILNTDAEVYGGSGLINEGLLKIQKTEAEEAEKYFVSIIIPPLSIIFLKPQINLLKQTKKEGSSKLKITKRLLHRKKKSK